jgi:hypothetical protein
MHDLKNNTKIGTVLVPLLRTADANGTGFDRKDFPAVSLLFIIGASGDTINTTNKIACLFEESDDNSTFTTVAAADLIGTLPVIDTVGELSQTYQVGYKGAKRYVRGGFDYSGTHSVGTSNAIIALGGNPRNAPVT